MVDVPRVAALLQRIRDELAELRRTGARDDAELHGSADALPAAKYRLVVVIEAAIDVADHLIASEGWRPSSSFADSFRSLHEAGMLDAELSASMEQAAGFKNLLVHQYADVDDARVVEILRTRLDDLDRFVAVVAAKLS